jgi:hypothetical protein
MYVWVKWITTYHHVATSSPSFYPRCESWIVISALSTETRLGGVAYLGNVALSRKDQLIRLVEGGYIPFIGAQFITRLRWNRQVIETGVEVIDLVGDY